MPMHVQAPMPFLAFAALLWVASFRALHLLEPCAFVTRAAPRPAASSAGADAV